jgi:hypothetical protein
MGLYVVEVDGVRYVVNVKQFEPGHFETQTHIASKDDKGDSDPQKKNEKPFSA